VPNAVQSTGLPLLARNPSRALGDTLLRLLSYERERVCVLCSKMPSPDRYHPSTTCLPCRAGCGSRVESVRAGASVGQFSRPTSSTTSNRQTAVSLRAKYQSRYGQNCVFVCIVVIAAAHGGFCHRHKLTSVFVAEAPNFGVSAVTGLLTYLQLEGASSFRILSSSAGYFKLCLQCPLPVTGCG
jgi:hypothetical protein